MAFFFGDGFDLYSAMADAQGYWDGSFGVTPTLGVSASGRFAGSRGAAILTSSGTTPYMTKTSGVNDAVHHISVAIQQTQALSGSTGGMWFSLYDGASVQCTVFFRSDGAMVLASPGVTGTVLATYTGAIAAINTWYQFEIEIVISNTAGSIAVRKLGNTVNDFFLGSLNTRTTANNYANKLGVSANWAAANAQVIDDVLWRSDASSVAWLGDIRCYTRMPASDASVQWTPSGSVVPVTPTVGNTTTGSVALNTGKYLPFTATYTGTIATATMPVGAAQTGNYKAAIYASSGSAPTTVLATSNAVTNPAVGTITFTFPSPPSVTRGTAYYFAFCTDTSSTGAFSYNNAPPASYLPLSGAATYASFPAANPTTAAGNAFVFSANITPGVGVNTPMVADPQQDGAATYVYSSTVGQSDLYGLGSLSATPGAIIGVTTRAYMQKSDAGSRIAAVQLQSGASNVQGSLTLNTTFGWASRNDLVDPATSAAWTATGVNNAQIGVVLTA